MSEERKPIVCLDFDGVIHSYESGWQGAAVVSDPPVPGAIEAVMLYAQKFNLHIYSARSGQSGGIDAMREWLARAIYSAWCAEGYDPADSMRRATDTVYVHIQWPTEKPPALVTLDDRAITFTGRWPTVGELREFQPWNKPADDGGILRMARDMLTLMENGANLDGVDDDHHEALHSALWDVCQGAS